MFYTTIGFRDEEINYLWELSSHQFSSVLSPVVSPISGSSAFSKTILNIWKFTVHILLKPGCSVVLLSLLYASVLTAVQYLANEKLISLYSMKDL